MTKRLHVLNDGEQTCVIVTDEPSVNAALKCRLLTTAKEAGLVEAQIVSTNPIQSPDKLGRLGLSLWSPLVYAGERATAGEIEYARSDYQTDEVQIDDDARVSRPADADCIWVQAWVWVATDRRGAECLSR